MIDARDTARKLVLGAAFWSGASALLAPLLAGAGSILMLHRVNRSGGSPLGLNSHLSVSPDFLDALLGSIKRRGLALLPLDELLEGLAAGRRGMVAITADDGWLDNLTDALPVFEAHDAPFTVYVTPGLMNGVVAPWWEVAEEFVAAGGIVPANILENVDRNDPRQTACALIRHISVAVPEEEQQAFLQEIGALAGPVPRRFMNWDELRLLAQNPLATLGAHTVHHYNLKRLDERSALREMTESAAIIATETGMRPRHFAYPYGYACAVGAREVDLAMRAGFASAVTTRHGVLLGGHRRHPHALPRLSVNGNYQRLSYMHAMLSGVSTPLANSGRRLVTV